MLGRKKSVESNEQNRQRNLGKRLSKETVDKILKTRRQEKHCFKPILQYDLLGNFIKEWECGMDIIRELGIKKAGECCRGKRTKAGGFIWKFKNVN